MTEILGAVFHARVKSSSDLLPHTNKHTSKNMICTFLVHIFFLGFSGTKSSETTEPALVSSRSILYRALFDWEPGSSEAFDTVL